MITIGRFLLFVIALIAIRRLPPWWNPLLRSVKLQFLYTTLGAIIDWPTVFEK